MGCRKSHRFVAVRLLCAAAVWLTCAVPSAPGDETSPKSAENSNAVPPQAVTEQPENGGGAPEPPKAGEPGSPPNESAPAEPLPADQPARVRENPLSRWLKKVFRSPKGRRTVEQDEDEPRGETGADAMPQDDIDQLAPHDHKQEALLRKAAASLQQQDWKQAVDLLQFLLESPEDSLVRLPDGRWVSIRWEANRLLAELPVQERKNYELQYGELARQLLADGRRSGDAARIVEVATKFFHTTSGQEAANLMGTLHLDRGEVGMAARWFARLIEASAPLTDDHRWQLKAAFTFEQAGNESGVAELLRELTDAQSGRRLELGGQPVEPGDWLKRSRADRASPDLELDDWPLFFGSPGRTGKAAAGEPLLLPRWSHQSLHSHQIREQIDSLVEDLNAEELAVIPAMFPLMVDGKLIYRTLRGVQVVEAQTGAPLWETREEHAAERLLIGAGADEPFGAGDPFQAQALERLVPAYNGYQASRHPLTGLLYRDGTYGIVSSDGRRLFVIDDHAVLASHQRGYSWNWRAGENDPFERDWSTNRIVCYDLNTGHSCWEVGGRRMEEPFDPALAGYYFFGAPVADGGELFAVGERDNEIRLLSIDAASGTPKWSQLIAFSDAKIERDLGRRWWTAQVAVSDGVLVCPTTVGWLVAVDRVNHAVLWAHRYADPKPAKQAAQRGQGRFESYVPPSDLNSHWCPAPPVIVGNRVVFTPPEFRAPDKPILVCLSLFDGKRLWEVPKGQDLYLAGVFTGRVIVVGETSVTARALDDGRALWTVPISAVDGRPSGVGVASGNRYYLPLESGQLWAINLESGELESKSYLPAKQRPLRNLAMYRGMLISLDAIGLRSFEQWHSLDAEIRRRREQNPDDPWALLQEADVKLVEREHAAALSLLRRVPTGELEPELAERQRTRMIEALASIVQSGLNADDPHLVELTQLVRTDDERFLLNRLSVERLAARGDYAAAFDLCLDLTENSDERTIVRRDDPRVSVDLQNWLAGHLADFWQKLAETERTAREPRIAEAARRALDADAAAQQRFADLFGFHPAAVSVNRQLAEAHAAAGELLRAENRLLRLARSNDGTVAASALIRLVGLLEQFGWSEDSRHYLERLERDYADVALDDETTVPDWIDQHRRKRQPQDTSRAGAPTAWKGLKIEMARSVNYYATQEATELLSGPQPLPFFQGHRFDVDQSQQRLEVMKAADESIHWLLPLRTSGGAIQQHEPSAILNDHQLVLLYRDVLQCISPLERKVLWARPLDTNAAPSHVQTALRRGPVGVLRRAAGFLARNSLAQQSQNDGLLVAANGDYICVRGRRDLRVFDALTGRPRWSCEDVAVKTAVFGNEDALYVLSLDRREAFAFRAADGKRLDIPDLTALLPNAMHIGEKGIVLVESGALENTANGGSQTVIRLYDPVSGTEHWRRHVPDSARLSRIETDQIVVLTNSGELSVISTHDGRVQLFDETIPPSGFDHSVFADDRLLYLVANKSRSRTSYGSSELPSLPVSGDVYAFDRANGEKLWQQNVSSQNLIYRHLNHSPILVFASRTYKRQNAPGYWLLSLTAIDKQTGRRLIETTMPSNTGFRTFDLNMAERYVELKLYNQSIRLVAVDQEAAASE